MCKEHKMRIVSMEKMFANVAMINWKCDICGGNDFTCPQYDDVHKVNVIERYQ